MIRDGQLLGWGYPTTCVLVETLLDRGTEADPADAEAGIDLLATDVADEGLLAIREIWQLRLRARLARARGDDAAHADRRDRYRQMAGKLGFDGDIAWADAMP